MEVQTQDKVIKTFEKFLLDKKAATISEAKISPEEAKAAKKTCLTESQFDLVFGIIGTVLALTIYFGSNYLVNAIFL